jgi:uncharacterized damage-inducible protein DinB
MKRIAVAAAMLVMTTASIAHAQNKASSANAAAQGITAIYDQTKGFLVAAAEQIPEDKYAFQPTKDVRTVGALFAHIADANNFFCGQISGQGKQYSDAVEKTAKTKAELVTALKASFAACDAAYGAVTDAELARPMTIFGMQRNLAGVLAMNAAHDMEHYGNLVTYMRIIGMTPPSSQR